MSTADAERTPPTGPRGRPAWMPFAIGSAVLLAVVVLVLLLSGDDDDAPATSKPAAPATAPAARPASVATNLTALKALARERGQSVFWVGRAPNRTFELTKTSDGSVYVRYLTVGAPVGDPKGEYLTIGSYPRTDPRAEIASAAQRPGAMRISLDGGAVAVAGSAGANSVFALFPGTKQIVEVYSPRAGRALELLRTGRVRPITPR